MVPKPADNRSIMERVAELPDPQRTQTLDSIVEKYCGGDEAMLKYTWELWRRGNQWFPEHDKWKHCAFLAGRGFGKALYINTLIPTPSGFTLMKDIEAGDVVFDENGKECKVTLATGTMYGRECYKITFNDGNSVVADADHEWAVWDRKSVKRYDFYKKTCKLPDLFPESWASFDPKKFSSRYLSNEDKEKIKQLRLDGKSYKEVAKIIDVSESIILHTWNKEIKYPSYTYTTRELLDKLNDDKIVIPTTKPVEYKHKELPIEPWCMGYMLGDGTTERGGMISCHQDDKGWLIREFNASGYRTTNNEKYTQRFSALNISKVWKDLELNKGKFIPEIYFRSSVEQRILLLSGMIDSDGHVDKHGGYSFYNTNYKLVEGIKIIAESLGCLVKVYERNPRAPREYNGKIIESKQQSYHVYIRSNFILAKLPRKAKKHRPLWEQQQVSRSIISIEKVDSVPVKCIQVDSKNNLYLCGDFYLPTHNTRVGAEIVRYMAENNLAKRIAIIAPTAHDATAVCLYGESGLMNISPPQNRPVYHPTYKKITWPNSEAIAYLFSAEDPESLRGHQASFVWADECAAWSRGIAVWQQIIAILRLGNNPRSVITTTPKANELIKTIVGNPRTWTVTGSTYENSNNISIDEMTALFEGTRLGKQELYGEILLDIDGALWKQSWIDKTRVSLKDHEKLPEFLYIVMAIDPAMTAKKNSDETGIAICAYGTDDKYYVLYADSHKESPHEWAKRALSLYDLFSVTSIVAETNQGGDMVLQNLQRIRPDIFITPIHAKKSKAIRAEPVAHLSELGKICFYGTHPKAEDQLCSFNPISNPDGKDDIVDSFCYSILTLMEKAMVSAVYNPAVGGLRHKLLNYRAR